MLEQHDFDVVLSDVRLPRCIWCRIGKKPLKLSIPEKEVILMTAFGNISDAVQAMKNGAYDYLVKEMITKKLFLLYTERWKKQKITDPIIQFQYVN